MDFKAIEVIYQERRSSADQMAPHMDTLRALAEECDTAVEFGVRRCNSTIALLAGGAILYSLDIDWPDKYAAIREKVQEAAGENWIQVPVSSIACEPYHCDLMLHDSLHNYEHVSKELRIHADTTKKFLVFHDTVSHGYCGQSASCGPAVENVKGIIPAIEELLERDSTWQVKSHDEHSAGLMVLERA